MIKQRNVVKPATIYRLVHNGKKTEFKLTRIKNLKEHYENLIKTKEMPFSSGFFIYKPGGFSSHLISIKIDIIYVDDDGVIIDMKKSLKSNIITKAMPDAKFLYILKENTIIRENIKHGDIIKHQK
jgi:hypothetical protein